MPWTETMPRDQREKFIRDLRLGVMTMTELCERCGIARKTGYKWLDQHFHEGMAGLKDRSRTPKHTPHKTPERIRELILDAKRTHPNWGAPKLVKWLNRKHPTLKLPAPSTAGALLQKEGLTKPRRKRRRWRHPGAPVLKPSAPNELWTVDFKGQFKTKDGIYCYPLTIADQFSRFLLACTGLTSVMSSLAQPVFTALSRKVGIPDAIRSDNGVPFCSPNAICGLSDLNVWWLELGIHRERTQPSSPQQNGAHERMHRTLKRDTTKPPAANLRSQQRKFDAFRHEYNDERPHEFLDDKTPADVWELSLRPFPRKIPKPDYPEGMTVRKVSTAGTFRLNSAQPFITEVLKLKYIALEEVDDGLWAVCFHEHFLAHYDERSKCFLD